jgi:hypothetical protein
MSEFVRTYLADSIRSFRNYKTLAERAIEQANDEEFFAAIDEEANSIAVLVKHMSGNLHSRWRDFLTSDGEKPERDRDTEFISEGDTRESLMQFWETGWRVLFDNLEPLTANDFATMITIRGEPHSIVEAISRQLTHYSYHIGQIVLLAKHFRSADWKTLSVPRNRSSEFNWHLEEKRAIGDTSKKGLEAGMEFAGIKKEDGRE